MPAINIHHSFLTSLPHSSSLRYDELEGYSLVSSGSFVKFVGYASRTLPV
jgi:hypothetical protein